MKHNFKKPISILYYYWFKLKLLLFYILQMYDLTACCKKCVSYENKNEFLKININRKNGVEIKKNIAIKYT